MAGDEKSTAAPQSAASTSSAPVPVTTSDVANAAPAPSLAPRVGIVNGDKYVGITVGATTHHDGDRIVDDGYLQPGEFDRLLGEKALYLEGTPKPKIKKAKPTRAGKPDDYEDPDDDDEDNEDDDGDEEDDDEDADVEVHGKHLGREVIASGALARSRGRK